jgi:hypothetical protein
MASAGKDCWRKRKPTFALTTLGRASTMSAIDEGGGCNRGRNGTEWYAFLLLLCRERTIHYTILIFIFASPAALAARNRI